ncbi:MAG TPA: glycoside hydrolase family 95 protein, partial [Mucilaginibacter sp.]
MKKGILTLLFLSAAVTLFAQNNLKLWYDKPSGSVWERALPIGNGRLAGMVYGNTERECIKLNEATVWSGGPNRNDSPTALAALPEVRKLIFEGKNKEAAKLAREKIKSEKINGMMYQPVGNLNLYFPGHDNVEHYYRELDLTKAVATTSYTVNGITFKREVFASAPDQVMVVHLTASKPASLSFSASMFSPQKSTVTTRGNDELVLSGITSDRDGIKGAVKFKTLVKLKTTGGSVAANDTAVAVTKADEVTLFISIATNFVSYNNISADEGMRAATYLSAALKKSYPQLLSNHIAAYQKYFNRVKFDLGTTDSVKNATDKRIADFANGNDPQLAALYFQFGRYLLISASQPGGQPATLQGLWNDKLSPPWGSKYTININTEMNYWPAEETNLAEMHEPLIQMVKELSVTGQQTARIMYGSRGWVAHHNTDLWRITGPVDDIYSGLWPSGGIWLSRHLWDKYLFNGNKAYLQSVYGAMKGAAQFCLDFLIEEPEHKWLVMSPSLSPENGPVAYGGVSIDAGVTMDNQLVFELFSNVINAATVLNTDKALVAQLIAARKRLPPM